MASPQLENGYTRIADELLEAFALIQLSGHEWSIIHAVVRKTYGFNKKEDWIAGSQLSELTGLNKQRVYEAKKKLSKKRILLANGKKVSLNKDYEQWIKSNGKTLLGNGKTLPKVTEKRTHKREKTIIQKTLVETSSTKSKNQNNMSWNLPNDNEADETSIDYETGEITDHKPVRQKKYPNAPTVRKLFQEILGHNPLNWKVNKTELGACERLYTEFGLKKVRNALEYYKENQDDKFCPVITSPSSLENKYAALSKHKTRNYGN